MCILELPSCFGKYFDSSISQYKSAVIKMQIDSETVADILLEAIEVIVNQILFLRGIYPAQIFKKRRIYDTPVHVSIFPPLNTYIAGLLRSARELLERRLLQCFEIVIYRNESTSETMESYKLDILQESLVDIMDPNLVEYEQHVRSALYKMDERLKQLPKLDKNCQFKIRLHTTQCAFVHLSHAAQHQEFPWLQTETLDQLVNRKFSLLPLVSVDQVGFKMQALIFS